MPISIARVQTEDRNVNQLQSNIAKALNPVLSNPISSGSILTGISLKAGANTVSHKLNRILQGWVLVRQRQVATIYDTQDTNNNPSLTLTLVSSADVVVDLYVF